MQSRPQWRPSAKRPRLDVITAAADRPQLVVARLVQVRRFETRSRYRRHLLYRYERADGGRSNGPGDSARAPVGRTIGHFGGKASSPARTQLSRPLLTPPGLPDRFGVQPGPVGFSRLAGWRGPSLL